MFLWRTERFRARSSQTAALSAPVGPPAPDSQVGDQEGGSDLPIAFPPLRFQLKAREDTACSERLPRCEVAVVSPHTSESALVGRRSCVPRRQELVGAVVETGNTAGIHLGTNNTFGPFADSAGTSIEGPGHYRVMG